MQKGKEIGIFALMCLFHVMVFALIAAIICLSVWGGYQEIIATKNWNSAPYAGAALMMIMGCLGYLTPKAFNGLAAQWKKVKA